MHLIAPQKQFSGDSDDNTFTLSCGTSSQKASICRYRAVALRDEKTGSIDSDDVTSEKEKKNELLDLVSG